MATTSGSQKSHLGDQGKQRSSSEIGMADEGSHKIHRSHRRNQSSRGSQKSHLGDQGKQRSSSEIGMADEGSHKIHLSHQRNQSTSSESNMTDKQAQGCPEEELEHDEDDKGLYYLPLYQAAREGDWAMAKEFIDRDPDALTAIISINSATALHVAALYGQSQFVEKMVEIMPTDNLAMQDCFGLTVLHLIATSGTVNAAKALVEKSSFLTQFVSQYGHTPLEYLCLRMSLISSREREMLWYLCRVTRDEEPCVCFSKLSSPPIFILVLLASGHFDVCLYLLQRHRELAKFVIAHRGVIEQLCAAAPDFPSGTKLGFFQTLPYKIIPLRHVYEQIQVRGDVEDPIQIGEVSFTMQLTTLSQGHKRSTCRMVCEAFIELLIAIPSIKKVYDIKLKHKYSIALLHYICQLILQQNFNDIGEFLKRDHAIQSAVRNGIVEIVAVFLRYFPDLMMIRNHRGEVLLHEAVKSRREKIFNLLMELSAPTTNPFFSHSNSNDENILHLAAKLAPSPQLNSVSGPALQMQRELQWFKEVEKLLSNLSKGQKNKDNKTPQELFTEEHKQLKEKGEQWMRDTSSQCLIVTTLIATIAFAAAFTVPGGNDDQKGTPIFLGKNSFIIFSISNALALFSSVTSLIMFLAILTARYAEEDFLLSLPKKMIIGLSSLFVAISTMMVSFGAGLLTVLGERLKVIIIPVILLSCVPVTLFGMLQLPLLVQMVRSTYGRSIFYRPGDHIYRDIAYKEIN